MAFTESHCSLLLLLFLVAGFHSTWSLWEQKQILDQILDPARYDKRIRPYGSNGTDNSPTVTHVNLFVRFVPVIDDSKMEWSVQVTLRQQWTDERLQFSSTKGKVKQLTLTDPNAIWVPDLFVSNEMSGNFHELMVPNVYLRLFPDGKVLYSARISMRLSCPMDLRRYPLDSQICTIRMASYGYTADDLVFLWRDGDPVQVVKNLHVPLFKLDTFYTDRCDSTTNTGVYSCLKVDMLFHRDLRHYLLQTYIPSMLLVVVSWTPFWFSHGANIARASVGVLTLLTMAAHNWAITAATPPVPYTRAIDVWNGACLTFLLAALAQFAIVSHVARRDASRKGGAVADGGGRTRDGAAVLAMEPLVRQPGENPVDDSRLTGQPSGGNSCMSWLTKFPSTAERVDAVSRLCFPALFALFNVVYWPSYQ